MHKQTRRAVIEPRQQSYWKILFLRAFKTSCSVSTCQKAEFHAFDQLPKKILPPFGAHTHFLSSPFLLYTIVDLLPLCVSCPNSLAFPPLLLIFSQRKSSSEDLPDYTIFLKGISNSRKLLLHRVKKGTGLLRFVEGSHRGSSCIEFWRIEDAKDNSVQRIGDGRWALVLMVI